MTSVPPKGIEPAIGLLIPPACREEVLGDLYQRYVGLPQYIFDAMRAVPLVILSRVRRTTDPADCSDGSAGPVFFVSGGDRGTSTARCWQNSGALAVGDTGGCRIVGHGAAGRLFRSGNPVALGGSAAALARCGVRASHCPIVANRAIVDRAGEEP